MPSVLGHVEVTGILENIRYIYIAFLLADIKVIQYTLTEKMFGTQHKIIRYMAGIKITRLLKL